MYLRTALRNGLPASGFRVADYTARVSLRWDCEVSSCHTTDQMWIDSARRYFHSPIIVGGVLLGFDRRIVPAHS